VKGIGIVGVVPVALAGGSPGSSGDAFSIIWTDSDIHEHGAPGPVTYGNLVVKAF
jgi:hypothetical protein